ALPPQVFDIDAEVTGEAVTEIRLEETTTAGRATLTLPPRFEEEPSEVPRSWPRRPRLCRLRWVRAASQPTLEDGGRTPRQPGSFVSLLQPRLFRRPVWEKCWAEVRARHLVLRQIQAGDAPETALPLPGCEVMQLTSLLASEVATWLGSVGAFGFELACEPSTDGVTGERIIVCVETAEEAESWQTRLNREASRQGAGWLFRTDVRSHSPAEKCWAVVEEETKQLQCFVDPADYASGRPPTSTYHLLRQTLTFFEASPGAPEVTAAAARLKRQSILPAFVIQVGIGARETPRPCAEFILLGAMPVERFACANPACQYMAAESEDFGGYCCKRCHASHAYGHALTHGFRCAEEMAHWKLPRAAPVAPPEPIRKGHRNNSGGRRKQKQTDGNWETPASERFEEESEPDSPSHGNQASPPKRGGSEPGSRCRAGLHDRSEEPSRHHSPFWTKRQGDTWGHDDRCDGESPRDPAPSREAPRPRSPVPDGAWKHDRFEEVDGRAPAPRRRPSPPRSGHSEPMIWGETERAAHNRLASRFLPKRQRSPEATAPRVKARAGRPGNAPKSDSGAGGRNSAAASVASHQSTDSSSMPPLEAFKMRKYKMPGDAYAKRQLYMGGSSDSSPTSPASPELKKSETSRPATATARPRKPAAKAAAVTPAEVVQDSSDATQKVRNLSMGLRTVTAVLEQLRASLRQNTSAPTGPVKVEDSDDDGCVIVSPVEEIEDVYPEDPEQLEEAVPHETEVAT
ncbi:hypothetical protein AK812_SmicGene5121, partial [Symbiodinium microadriaticum]